jgi:hypothetical protein
LAYLVGQALLQHTVQVGIVDAVIRPQRDAEPIVDRDRLGPRQDHLDQLSVGIQRSRANWYRRVVQRCKLHSKGPFPAAEFFDPE